MLLKSRNSQELTLLITLLYCWMMFESFVDEIALEIEEIEERHSRAESVQQRFRYAVRTILLDCWKASKSIPVRVCQINRRSNFYSNTNRYADPNLAYRQVTQAFEGLLNLGLIFIERQGFYDRQAFSGGLTQYIPTKKLLERLTALEGHPALSVETNLSTSEMVLLRDRVSGRRMIIDYEDDEVTTGYRDNLIVINSEYAKHWLDLRIPDKEVPVLAKLHKRDEDKQPIDFSKRYLYRVFTRGSFKKGGRFYGGWWQNVKKQYRPYITIDEDFTTERDYSQLHPHLMYFSINKKMGKEDAYGRVFDGEHRDLVKVAFNAMTTAETTLISCPTGLNLTGYDFTWRELRQRIINAHKPIEHLFFKGEGVNLQYEDSQIVEDILLQSCAEKAPVYPIHDSFIVKKSSSDALEEMMRRAIHDRYGEDIPIDQKLTVEETPLYKEDGTSNIEQLVMEDRQYSQWFDRNTMWLFNKGKSESSRTR